MLPRLFGNTTANCVEGGTIAQNGCGKFNDITAKALRTIHNLGATHVWYTGILEHTTRTDYTQYGIENTHLVAVGVEYDYRINITEGIFHEDFACKLRVLQTAQ